MGKDTPVGKFVEKKGPGIHHLALEVDDIEESLAKAKKERSRTYWKLLALVLIIH